MADRFQSSTIGLDGPGLYHYAITPSDTVDFPESFRAIYVGGGGNVVVVANDGVAVSYIAVPTGSTIPMRGKRVNVTGTTATGLVGMY